MANKTLICLRLAAAMLLSQSAVGCMTTDSLYDEDVEAISSLSDYLEEEQATYREEAEEYVASNNPVDESVRLAWERPEDPFDDDQSTTLAASDGEEDTLVDPMETAMAGWESDGPNDEPSAEEDVALAVEHEVEGDLLGKSSPEAARAEEALVRAAFGDEDETDESLIETEKAKGKAKAEIKPEKTLPDELFLEEEPKSSDAIGTVLDLSPSDADLGAVDPEDESLEEDATGDFFAAILDHTDEEFGTLGETDLYVEETETLIADGGVLPEIQRVEMDSLGLSEAPSEARVIERVALALPEEAPIVTIPIDSKRPVLLAGAVPTDMSEIPTAEDVETLLIDLPEEVTIDEPVPDVFAPTAVAVASKDIERSAAKPKERASKVESLETSKKPEVLYSPTSVMALAMRDAASVVKPHDTVGPRRPAPTPPSSQGVGQDAPQEPKRFDLSPASEKRAILVAQAKKRAASTYEETLRLVEDLLGPRPGLIPAATDERLAPIPLEREVLPPGRKEPLYARERRLGEIG